MLTGSEDGGFDLFGGCGGAAFDEVGEKLFGTTGCGCHGVSPAMGWFGRVDAAGPWDSGCEPAPDSPERG